MYKADSKKYLLETQLLSCIPTHVRYPESSSFFLTAVRKKKTAVFFKKMEFFLKKMELFFF